MKFEYDLTVVFEWFSARRAVSSLASTSIVLRTLMYIMSYRISECSSYILLLLLFITKCNF